MIMRIFTAMTIAVALVINPAMAEEKGSSAKATKDQASCPISGKAISKEVYVDHDSKRIYLCCAGCKDKATADAEKIIADYKAKGIKLEQISKQQALCPVMGGEINKDIYSDHKGKRVYLCCAMCKPKFEETPAKYIKEMEAAGIALEKVKKSG